MEVGFVVMSWAREVLNVKKIQQGSPTTPSMHVMCFGEHEVSANTTPTTIGSLGDFVNRPGSGMVMHVYKVYCIMVGCDLKLSAAHETTACSIGNGCHRAFDFTHPTSESSDMIAHSMPRRSGL